MSVPVDHRYRHPGAVALGLAALQVSTFGIVMAFHRDGWWAFVIAALGVFALLVGAAMTAGELAKPCRPVEDDTLAIVVDHSKVPPIPRALRDERGRS